MRADWQWFAVQTRARAEEKAVRFLALKHVSTFLPRVRLHRRHGSRRWEVLEPLFPGYLFARFTLEPQVVDSVRWTPGVRKVLGDGQFPIPVPEDIVAFLQERVGERGGMFARSGFRSGMHVRFIDGPFAHLEGIIQRPASGADRVRVLLELLGRPVSIEVDTYELERA